EEIRRFKMLGGSDRIIPVIVAGEPGDPDQECFPPALIAKLNAEGAPVSTDKEERLAADVRSDKGSRELAKQKIVAGLLGLSLDEIARRADRAGRRHNRVVRAVAGTFLFLAIAATASAFFAYQKLIESEQRLDQAIEIAYGFVAEAAGMSDRFGIPS